MDSRKGNVVIHNRLTIDTVSLGKLCITEEKEDPAVRKNNIPQRSPDVQKNARIGLLALRNKDDLTEHNCRAKKNALLKRNESKPAYVKNEGVYGTGIAIP